MRRLQLLIALVAALAAGAGAGSFRGGSFSGGSFEPLAQSHQAGGVARVDTSRVWTHHWKFPNNAAKAAGYVYADTTRYTTINRVANGQNMMWGWIRKDLPDSVQASTSANGDGQNWSRACGGTTQRGITWNANQRQFFLWVTANGLRNGQKVEEAYVTVNAAAGFTLPAGVYLSARLDSIARDYRINDANSVGLWSTANNDSSRFKATWNQLVRAAPSAWNPTLDSRGDYCDFGPRSSTTFGSAGGNVVIASGTPLRFNVTDAVQQALDNGTADRGFLFVFYAYSSNGNTTSYDFAAGNSVAAMTAYGGNPIFTAVTTNRRGPQVWDGAKVPVILCLDDSKDAHIDYYPVIAGAGLRFTAMNNTGEFNFNASWDSLYTPNAANIDIVHHANTHTAIGLLTGADLNAQIELNGWYDDTYWTTPPDTNLITSFAFTQGATQSYSMEAIKKIMAHGFTSSRAILQNVGTTPIGIVRYPAWDLVSNMMAMPCIALVDVQTVDAFYDKIDLLYTDGGKSAMILYLHNEISPAALQSFIDMVNGAASACRFMSYYDMIECRTRGAEWLDPATITVANGYLAAEQTSAAKYDSLRTADGDDNMLRVWIAPK